MNASERLDNYLAEFRARLRKRTLVGGLALWAVFALGVSVALAYIAIRSGFADTVVWPARIALISLLALGVYAFIRLPMRWVSDSADNDLESRVAQFEGRIHTYSTIGSANPMRTLLAEDALQIATKNSVEDTIPSKQIGIPIGISVLALIAALWLLFAGPGLFNFSLQHLFAGWAVDGLLPPQVISVTPGDELIRRGGRLNIEVSISGFEPDSATLHVQNVGGEWREVAMTPMLISSSDDSEVSSAYDFTFFSVREPMSYYVSALGVRTPEYQVDVVDLPGIKNLKLTYNYPEWTGLDPELKEQGGDIQAIPGTRIDLEVVLDSPIPSGEVILNGNSQNLLIAASSAFTDFEIEADGKYYIAALLGGEQVRLSDDYFITVAGDKKPEIKFVRPGRDWRASNIEEVTIEIVAEDDFRLVNMELKYSVNGGEWESVSLPADQNKINVEYLFYLEDMGDSTEQLSPASTTTVMPPVVMPLEEGFVDIDSALEPETGADMPKGIVTGLVAGDLISYYAVVKDRSQQAQTDMFFVEVQPFDRRFSQSQQAGGGMGGGQQGASEQEISQRQREIIVSTWNLLREQTEADSAFSNNPEFDGRVTDNSLLLSGLQASLAEEAQSLIETATSRQLTSDPRVKTYTKHLEKAIDAMTPASERLAEIDLEKAIQPEQTALQHLLRADAVFNDIQVSMSNPGSGGMGGGQAGADLAEMFELEMDLEQNRYETGERATPEAASEETENVMDELAELARRQERLAENLGNTSTPMEEQRWQQELLRRETEELRERLTDMAQQPSNGQQGQSGQQGQAGQQGQPGQSGQTGQPGQSGQSGSQSELADSDNGQPNSPQQDELNRRLESALDAMDRVSKAMQGGDTTDLARAAAEAQRQLEGAGERMEQGQNEAIAQGFDDMARDAAELYTDQRALEDELMAGIRKAVAEMPAGTDRISDPFTYEEHTEFGSIKRDMLGRLQTLNDEMQRAASQVKRESPGVARALEAADQALRESEITSQLDRAAAYMNQGATLYIANSESIVTSSLRELRERLDLARQMYNQADRELDQFDQTLADLQASRDEIRELVEGSQSEAETGSGNSGMREQTNLDDQVTGAPGEGGLASSGQQETGSAPGQATGAQWGGGGEQGRTEGLPTRGYWADARTFDRESAEAANRELGQLASGIGGVIGGLRDRGVSEGDVGEIQNLVRQLQNDVVLGDQNSIVELSRTLALLEQLEQKIAQGLDAQQVLTRNERVQEIPNEYKDAVANYYRLLSAGSDAAESEIQ
ncbi:MAG: hypothetical protein P8J68_08265 [Arenicellaceae bacterium]|nr:hypothetical protein [Arenicellaceae bacterium]